MASSITLDFYEDARGKWRWRLRSQNGNTVLASTQGYTTLVSAGENLARASMMLGAMGVDRFFAHAPAAYFNYKVIVPGKHDHRKISKT
jgi:uncharacterized protein YegP (UPF0339 family)